MLTHIQQSAIYRVTLSLTQIDGNQCILMRYPLILAQLFVILAGSHPVSAIKWTTFLDKIRGETKPLKSLVLFQKKHYSFSIYYLYSVDVVKQLRKYWKV